jgi:DNA polymerase III sliding clamp (beta) subunit (PCNA family)
LLVHVNHSEFLGAVKKASCAAAREGSVLPLRGLLIEADKREGLIRLTSSDTAVSISTAMPARIGESGAAVIANIRLLLDYLAIKPQGELSLALDQNGRALTIGNDTGNARLDIRTFPESEYPKPDIPMPGETVYVAGLKSLIAKTAFVASGSEIGGISKNVRLTLTGDGITAEAVSSFTVAKSKGDPEARGGVSLLIPAEALKILGHISDNKDVFELGIAGSGENGKTAVFFDGTTLFTARLTEGKFPDTEAFLSTVAEAFRAKVRAKDFLSALGCATVPASPKDPVEISFAGSEMRLKCKSGDTESSGVVPVTDFSGTVSAAGPYFFNASHLAG